jgi:hypothetical protein
VELELLEHLLLELQILAMVQKVVEKILLELLAAQA